MTDVQFVFDFLFYVNCLNSSEQNCIFNLNCAVDHSRVILKERDPNVIGSDYVNANFVGVSSHYCLFHNHHHHCRHSC